MSRIDRVAVLGAGTMGHGIAQVCAAAGCSVWLHDVDEVAVSAGVERIRANLDKGVERGKLTADERDATLSRVAATTDVARAVREAARAAWLSVKPASRKLTAPLKFFVPTWAAPVADTNS